MRRRGPLAELPIKWVEGGDAETVEIAPIAGDDGQAMNGCGSGDHGVFHEAVRLAMHEASPGTEGPRVHTENVVGFGKLFQPRLDLSGLA